MDVQLAASLSSSRSSGGKVPVAVSVHQECLRVACPDTRASSNGTVVLHNLSLATEQTLTPRGHRESVRALAFSSSRNHQPLLLCSASQSCIQLWEVEVLDDEGVAYSPREYQHGAGGGDVSDVEFSIDGGHVAVSIGNVVLVLNTQSWLLDTTLIGHGGVVSCTLFTSLHPLTIITLSDDRTFKVWNLENSSITYQSHIISSSPFLCGAVDLQHQHIATGTADGMLRVFDLRADTGFNCLLKCDIGKVLSKQQQVAAVTTPPMVEVGCAVVGVCYVGVDDTTREDWSSLLLVLMQMSVLNFNAQTLELLDSIHFSSSPQDPLIPALATCCFAQSDSQVFVASGAHFSDQVVVLSWHFLSEGDSEGTSVNSSNPDTLSVLSHQPLLESSPLHSTLTLKTKLPHSSKGNFRPCPTGRPVKSVKTGRPGGGLDQPLTFKSKVKSSGYSTQPRVEMFRAKTKGKVSKMEDKTRAREIMSYPTHPSPTSYPYFTRRVSDKPVPTYCISFNGSGSMLACGSADKAVYVLKMPPTTSKTTAMSGHDGAVLSTSWSHSEQWLLTSSADRTARVWSAACKDTSLITLDRTRHNFKDSEDKKQNELFKKVISFAQFYYMDQFILLTCGSRLHLYKYHIDTHTPDDIKRYNSNSRYKLVTSLQMDSSQSITALSAINDFHSYLVFVGGSNKTLEVFDMNVGRCVRTLPDVHSRPVHCICQSKGSRYVTPQADGHYDMFVTSSLMDGMKLWDLRANKCVCRYSCHANQSQPSVLAAISPCAQYIATGSENRSAYIYDVRHCSSPLHKLSGHSDTVSAVAYHPLKPLLATTTLDGQVRFFTEQS